MSTGYANRVIHLDFSEELAEPQRDDKGQPLIDTKTKKPIPSEKIWVTLRNPRLVPPATMIPRTVPTNPDGTPTNPEDQSNAMFEIFARLILGWRCYDADDIAINPETGEELPQSLLPQEITVDNVKKLPAAIVNKIAETIQEGANPN
jgi:hypothetical protein